MKTNRTILLGQQPVEKEPSKINEGFKDREGDLYYEIGNYKAMDPFFMTICSDANHWMFISSTGGLTAGRVNSESALFPYYTDDRITENAGNTGPATVLLVTTGGKTHLWKPFTHVSSHVYKTSSAVSKNIRGNKILFEETNETLNLSFSYQWMNSRKFGWIRRSVLKNLGEAAVEIEIVDGLRNVLPAGTSSKIQNTFGNLLNAYKKSEIDKETGLGIFALSATLTDLAEPSESLKANVIWSCGLNPKFRFLSDRQLDSFSTGAPISSESENKGERGSYFIGDEFHLGTNEEKAWYLVADVDKDHSAVNDLKTLLLSDRFKGPEQIEEDVQKGCSRLDDILSQNDGIQKSAVQMNSVHHQANVMYNIMRGGYYFKGNVISPADLSDFVSQSNKEIGEKYGEEILRLGEEALYGDVLDFVLKSGDGDLIRIWYEYLPLSFSRRHGDPSRPWNVFSIETEKEDGSPKLDFQGNWRDIFQNWEALSYSYPMFLRHIIGKFLNATTADGYNPYRISRSGIDWEVPEPGNPWANIGYWSDHQIIYLLKLLEMYRNFFGDKLIGELSDRDFCFGEVPYEIGKFDEILNDPYNTISFNWEKQEAIMARAEEKGSEGKLLHTSEGSLVSANMTEKLLILLLAKLGNFVPGGGIWMNTQRPEWNDANNALVGKGISVVTLAYVRRFTAFLIDLYKEAKEDSYLLSSHTAKWFESIAEVMKEIDSLGSESIDSASRLKIVSELGVASEQYREKLYNGEFGLENDKVGRGDMIEFLETALRCIDRSLKLNRREDNLYHSYNTLEITKKGLIIHNLYEMLEGQVAILSSGVLKPEDAMDTLDALKASKLYRADQNSYMLYPDRNLPGFLEKNNIDPLRFNSIKLLRTLVEDGNRDLVCKDGSDLLHFHGDFCNVKQVRQVLEILKGNEKYTYLVEKEGHLIEELFESTFDHQSFTGRSGTFFSFEGLGSIYWHMVSKLLLSVQEVLYSAVDSDAKEEIVESLKEHYYDVRAGIGYNKSSKVYGSFPFEPYSHTPGGKGARQPGMTGQVKEEVITRLAETGIRIIGGRISFDPTLVDRKELFDRPEKWEASNSHGEKVIVEIPEGGFAASICQTPYSIGLGDDPVIKVHYSDSTLEQIKGTVLPQNLCKKIYERTGEILWIEVII